MIAHLLAAAALFAPQPRASNPCISRDQAGDVTVLVMAEGFGAIATQCTPRLPETAFLRSPDGGSYLQRLRVAADGRRAAALAALNTVLPGGSGAEAMLAALGSGTTKPDGSALEGALCREFDRLAAALAPLPPENVAAMVSALAGMGIALEPTITAEMAAERRRSPNAAATPNPFALFCKE